MRYFDTSIEEDGDTLSGPYRSPVQMLQLQKLDSTASIHDNETAQKLGFQGGTIEGPTHFSQFEPLGERLWGERWFTGGCISAHFKAPAFEGDKLKAFMTRPDPDTNVSTIWLLRDDGTEILRGTAGVEQLTQTTALQTRLRELPPLVDPVIHAEIEVGTVSARAPVRMGPDDNMGDLYPFSLRQKLAAITERATVHGSTDNQWRAAVVPLEMISVMIQSAQRGTDFVRRGPAVGLFADLEVRLVAGPVLVGKDYDVSREVVFLSGSRRTESMWVLSKLWEQGTNNLIAEMLLNEAAFKNSYEKYEADYEKLYR